MYTVFSSESTNIHCRIINLNDFKFDHIVAKSCDFKTKFRSKINYITFNTGCFKYHFNEKLRIGRLIGYNNKHKLSLLSYLLSKTENLCAILSDSEICYLKYI